MKLDQVAYYCASKEAEEKVKKLLGLEKAQWLPDRVVAQSRIWSRNPATNVGELQFNYDLGIEIEILRYVEGPFWHDPFVFASEPFISHIGFHLGDDEPFPEMPGCRLAQETFTESHTAEYLTTGAGAGRRYHYRVHLVGQNYMKFIKRIPPNVERVVEWKEPLK